MSGASSRRKGHEAERMVARWLRENGFPDACTTRSKLGTDGTHTPGDVDFHPLITLEVKFVESGSRWPTWCRQAAAEAPQGTVPVVVRRTRGVTDVGLWECRYQWLAWTRSVGRSPDSGADVYVDGHAWPRAPFAVLVAALQAVDA